MERAYTVFDFYKNEGPVVRIAKHKNFEYLTLLIISFNAIWIGVDTDRNTSISMSTAKPVFQVMENFFAWYFAGEVIIRFMAFERKSNCLRDNWFKFDTVLVLLMLFETWYLPIA